MSHPQNDMITWGMMLRKVPTIVRALPRVVRGMRAANVTDPAQSCGLGWHFEQATQRNPDGAALLYGDRVLSYREANQQANRIAHHLQAQGIAKGDVVALFIENRPMYWPWPSWVASAPCSTPRKLKARWCTV